ncbi:SPOR domain-containing protein [Muriicola sp. Z0-33]|uniref:HU domain-containing protein n=1 Tax=Muriicola sp. Z0-33 TaxID=2816957 RepID=UPI0022374551|nr:SPOR domain-containing protein [Muriicola sp. Z0-33]MCW5514607.1 SPOR domain-containing protein [Muriicola sp. Z0-33]
MGTDHYIQELLYRYNCVVVPEFGAFLTQMKSAVIHKSTNAFSPPSKIISFNEQLISNDGLLVSYMANAEGVSYEEMLKKTLESAKVWRKKLKIGERLELPNIGELWLNREGKIQFQPSYKVNYLTSSFGLSSFVSLPVTREVLKETVTELEEKIPFIITPEQRKRSNFRPYLKYAAIILLALSTGLTGFRFYNETTVNQQLAREDAQEVVSKNIQEATFFNADPMVLPALELEVTKKVVGRQHHIIAGAFRMQKNAEKKVKQLHRRGFDEATYIGTNAYGLHQVTYASFTDPKEALTTLRKIKRTISSDAWLLSTK